MIVRIIANPTEYGADSATTGTMTVNELLENLSGIDGNTPVIIDTCSQFGVRFGAIQDVTG